MIQLSPRQIHLDFHTSEHITGIAAEFDPAEFARTFKEASVSSVTVFARCHHGWLYYPSRKFPERVHPNLEHRNLLVEQVRALHNEGIRAPIYITVQWDYFTANMHPEWLIRKADGSHEGSSFSQPGFYQSLCVNTGYFTFLKEHTEEICKLMGKELDGLFFDIVGIRPCYCACCRLEMKRNGIDINDERAVRAFAKNVLTRFKNDMSMIVRKHNADCTIFYNAGHVGPCTKDSADTYTHFELESLPGDSWGYLHFPVTARYARTLGKDCMGMTGKFHTGWGDFHSLKNLAALEFECFRMLSYGFACSIGDQLEPYGRLNAATYRLIGKVYSQFEKYEEWARPSKPVVEAALLTYEDLITEHHIPEDIMGAAQLLEELSIQFDIVDVDAELNAYRLIILPDGFKVTEAFQKRLDAYVKKGGKVLACCDGGLNTDENKKAPCFPSCFGIEYIGKTEKYPTFIEIPSSAIVSAPGSATSPTPAIDAPVEEIAVGLEPGNEYVVYLRGNTVRPKSGKNGATPLLNANEPYFSREGELFCSHRYTPSSKKSAYPAILHNKSGSESDVIYFTHPIFTQYRHNAPLWCKQLIKNAINMLLPRRIITHNGPSTVSLSVLHQPEKNRVAVHILTYIPVRKCMDIDIVEERTCANDLHVYLNLPDHIGKRISKARLAPEGEALAFRNNEIIIPAVNGYAVVEVEVE